MRQLDWIVVHTCAAYDAKRRIVVHQSVEMVREIHKRPVAAYDSRGGLIVGTGGRGFKDIGYHRYIERDGKIRLGRLDAVAGAHVEHFNARSLGVCCSGHGDHEAFNPLQLASLVAQCVAWCRLYSLTAENVIGHNETEQHGGPHVAKSCPGKLVDMHVIRERVRAVLAGLPTVPDLEAPTRR
jgi:hypothetical protein